MKNHHPVTHLNTCHSFLITTAKLSSIYNMLTVNRTPESRSGGGSVSAPVPLPSPLPEFRRSTYLFAPLQGLIYRISFWTRSRRDTKLFQKVIKKRAYVGFECLAPNPIRVINPRNGCGPTVVTKQLNTNFSKKNHAISSLQFRLYGFQDLFG